MVTQTRSARLGRAVFSSLPMTREIHKELTDEIDRLETNLAQLAARWAQERAAGAEEPESPALTDHSILQARWNSLAQAARSAEITEQDAHALIGSHVTFRRSTGAVETYRLVPPGMSDPHLKRISADSALGATLLGRRANDEAVFLAPSGEQRLRVMNVS